MMDGLHQIGPGPANGTSFLGVLYAEDFDTPEPPPAPVLDPVEPMFTLAELEAAQAEAAGAASRAARAEWEAGAAHVRTESLHSIAALLTAAQDGAQLLAEEVADGTARAILSVLAGLLPHLSRLHGEEEVRAMLRHLLPQLSQQPRITIRVHSSALDGVREDLRLLDEELAAVVAVTALDTLDRGDARVGWTSGKLRRDGGAIAGVLRTGLLELGLLEADSAHVPTQPERRNALAE